MALQITTGFDLEEDEEVHGTKQLTWNGNSDR
jgi:hypothetical protein